MAPGTLSAIDERRGRGAKRARLSLVLEAQRPLAGSLRVSLAGTDQVRIGRGDARTLRRSVENGERLAVVEAPDPWLSTHHARLVELGGRWALEDLGSKNGSRVNGIAERRRVLDDGDLVELGQTFFVYRDGADETEEVGDLVGVSTMVPAFARELERLDRAAASDLPVLVRGESGTGKELAARLVHERSGRRGRFVGVNCGALPASLVESELFGYRRGAFSGATEDRPGLVRAADGGTLFLDEIGDLAASSQAALLRVLQEREVFPLGATEPVRVDLRVVAATHRDLSSLREDLLARLAGFTILLPPLRDRREDLGLLVASLLPSAAGESRLAPDAARALLRWHWPRNVRELERVLAAAAVLAPDGRIELEHLPAELREAPAPTDPTPAEPLSDADRALRERLVELLRTHDGNLSAIARSLGKDRTQVRRWIVRFGLGRDT